MSEVWVDRYLVSTSILESIQAREPTAWACGCKLDKDRDRFLLCGFHEFMFEKLRRNKGEMMEEKKKKTNDQKNVPWSKALQDEFQNNVTFGKEAPWEKSLQKARLRDNYTYTVHTTSRQGEEESKDCFYGWGDPRKGEGCIQHTALDGLSFDNAAWISRLLANLGFQVVVTRSDDWSKVVNDANVAMRYDAGHVH